MNVHVSSALSNSKLATAIFFTLSAAAHAAQSDKEVAFSKITVAESAPADSLALDEQVQTGSRLGLTPRETPATVVVVDRETIEQRGAVDTQEILKSVPGMTAASPPGSAGSVSYRGFGASSLTQLFNGITVQYDAIAARPVDSWIYDRVEVVGGPSTYLYGAGAVGGSINYITKQASRDSEFVQARVSVGSYVTTQLSFGINQRIGDDAGVKNYLRADVNRASSNGYVDGNKRESWTAAASWLIDITPALSHTLALEFQKEDVNRPYWGTPLLNPTTGEGRIDEATRFKNYNSRDGIYQQEVRWARSLLEYRLGEHTSLRNTLYHYDALRDYRNVETYRFNSTNTAVARSSPLLQRHDQDLNGNRLELTHAGHIGGLQSDWSAGLDYSINKQTRFPRSLTLTVSTVDPINFVTEEFFSIPGMVPGFTPDRNNRVTTTAAFVENRTRFTNALSLVTGLRYEQIDLEVANRRTVTATDPAYFKRTYTPVTGRAGLVFDFSPASSVYLQYSTAADPPAGILTTANFNQVRDFDLTTGRQIELGTKWDVLDGRGALTAAVYHIVRKNLAIADANNPGTTIPVGQQSSRGAEVAASVRIAKALSLQGNVAYTDAQYDDFIENVSGVGVSREGNVPGNTPKWVANLWAAYDITANWRAGVDARYVSSRFGNNANTISDGAYTLFGAFASYQPDDKWLVTARARNIADTIYASSVTGTPMFYLGAPRTFELELRASF